MKHFVVTRLGLCVYSECWFEKLIGLFEAITLSSVMRQTSNEFDWLIVVDAAMPPKARERLEGLLRPHANLHLVAIDVTRVTHVRQGCFDWVWDRCQDFILEFGLLDEPSDYVITSVIDADDAWHRDMISTVNAFMSERLPPLRVGEERRGTWLRHTSGIAATFPLGNTWFITANAMEPMNFPFMSMAVFIAARFSSGISACSSRHRGWPSYCEVLAFEVAQIERDQPMWIYSRHDLSTQPWDVGMLAPVDPCVSEQLYDDFGIDRHKIEHWREQYYPAHGTTALPTAHAGCDISEQYDRVFRIAALNRQIEALKHRRKTDGARCYGASAGEFLDETLTKREARRASLIDELRAMGSGASSRVLSI
jgi:hypothetical protein